MNKQRFSLGMKLNQKQKFSFLLLISFVILMLLILKMEIIENLQNSLIFYPSAEFNSSPKDENIPHEEVYIDTEDGEKLHGYFFPSPLEKTNKVFIYLHGNAQNVGDWYIAPVEIQKHMPVNALLIDYRGYGKSTGKPTVEGTIKDALAMYNYLLEKGYKAENISVYGRSIGGAIALELANKIKVKSIVVQSSFTSLKDIAKELYPYVPSLLINDDYWNSKKLIKKVTCPILISHGDKDEIVPPRHSYQLYELANEPKKLIILKGATHNDISSFLNDEYFNTLKEFFI